MFGGAWTFFTACNVEALLMHGLSACIGAASINVTIIVRPFPTVDELMLKGESFATLVVMSTLYFNTADIALEGAECDSRGYWPMGCVFQSC